jgi:hypothetical protein
MKFASLKPLDIFWYGGTVGYPELVWVGKKIEQMCNMYNREEKL